VGTGSAATIVAAAWFSGAAAMPVIFFFLVFGGFPGMGSKHVDLRVLLFFSAMPMSAAALFGFRVGSSNN